MNMRERMAHHYKGGEKTFINRHNFLKDKHLYAAEGYGRLILSPAEKRVAEKTKLTLTYCVGVKGLAEGNILRFYIIGFNPLSMFEDGSARQNLARIKMAVSNSAKIEMKINNSFQLREIILVVAGGQLYENDTIDLVIGEGNTLALSEVARPVVFFVEFRKSESDKIAKLIDRATLLVRPGPLKKIRLLADPIIDVRQPQDVKLNALDEFSNLQEDVCVEVEITPAKGVQMKCMPALLSGDGGARQFNKAFNISIPGTYRLAGKDRISGIEIISPPIKAVENKPKYQLYFGDLHAHDCFSPGLASPMEYYQNAMKAGYHFTALPIQTHGRNLDHDRWILSNFVAEEYYQTGVFVTFPSFEWQQYAFGHKNVYYLNPDQPYLCPYDKRYDMPDKLFTALRNSDALVIPHHPGYKLDCHVPGTDWNYVDEKLQPVMEICSCHGSSEKCDSERPLNNPGAGGYFQDVLAKGIHMGVIGGSDSHSGWPVNSPREPRQYPGGMTCIYAAELTRLGVFEALRNRRCYGTTGARIILEFQINGHEMGEIIRGQDERRISVKVAGTDKLGKVEIIKNNSLYCAKSSREYRLEFEINDNSDSGRDKDFYYVKVIQADGEMAWSSPIWCCAGLDRRSSLGKGCHSRTGMDPNNGKAS